MSSDPVFTYPCPIIAEFREHRDNAKKTMAQVQIMETTLTTLGEHAKHLPKMAHQNEAIADEIRGLRDDLVKQLAKLLEAQSGRVAEGYIPLATYVEHVNAYKDTYKFFAKIAAFVLLSLFGLAKAAPAVFQMVLPHGAP